MYKTRLNKLIAFVFISLILARCSIFQPGTNRLYAMAPDTETPTLTQLPTETPTPEATATPTKTATPALGKESTMTWEKDGMEMMYVPGGEFEMGSNDGGNSEKPVHTVYLDAYWMDKYEVTNAQYEQCVAQGVCQASVWNDDSMFNGSSQPVVGVRWKDAKAYCEWAGRRLPTEAEWEKAARGTDDRIYPWGNQAPKDDLLNWRGSSDGYQYTAPVGSFTAGASPYGVMDMAGNVWEWTADCYGAYEEGRQENPTGASCSNTPLVRGGSWYSYVSYVRSASRFRLFPDFRSLDIGFRCAAPL